MNALTQEFRGQLADKLGHLLAQRSELDDQINELKDALKKDDEPAEGDLFRATVVHSMSTRIDSAEVEKHYKAIRKPVPQKVVSVVSVRVTAR